MIYVLAAAAMITAFITIIAAAITLIAYHIHDQQSCPTPGNTDATRRHPSRKHTTP